MNKLEESQKFNPFAGPEIEKVIYTTKSQSEIWTSCYFGGNDANRAYNLSFTIDFDGLLNTQAIELAIQTLVNRHESLRAAFSIDGVYMSIFKQLSKETDTEWEFIDGSYIKSHQHSTGAAGQDEQAIGLSRGGNIN